MCNVLRPTWNASCVECLSAGVEVIRGRFGELKDGAMKLPSVFSRVIIVKSRATRLLYAYPKSGTMEDWGRGVSSASRKWGPLLALLTFVVAGTIIPGRRRPKTDLPVAR